MAGPTTAEKPIEPSDSYPGKPDDSKVDPTTGEIGGSAGRVNGFDDLLNQVDRDVQGWRPEPGDRIYGVVVDVTEGESDYGLYPLIVVDSPEHEELVGVHCFHTTIMKDVTAKIARGTLVIGSQIAISYRGEGEARNGNNAPHLYRVAVRPPAA